MKISVGALALLSLVAPNVYAATCGGGSVGDGICPDRSLCCSEWGWCGASDNYCSSPTSPSPPAAPTPVPGPTPTPPSVAAMEDSRMVAFLGNWQACPTPEQLAQYTHILISFAVSYTWNPTKNQCSTSCEIATPPVCNNSPNQPLIDSLHAAGKKVILSFGGAGMGGSWSSSNNDCWDYCFGREDQVVNRLTEIVNDMNLDGIDIDYEYFYENNQNGSGFSKGIQAQDFLRDVTLGLRASLPAGSEITHTPMDVDVVPGKAYYDIISDVASSIDYLMPQYYNGITRPAENGFNGGSVSASGHYGTLVNDVFQGDATKVVFGFCISDCSGTGSNANADQAKQVMADLSSEYSCNGGAFFWVAAHDINGAWSGAVNQIVQQNAGCNPGSPANPPASPPTNAPVSAPTDAPVPGPTDAPVPASTDVPVAIPTDVPVPTPTDVPVSAPTEAPISVPTDAPVSAPTDAPVLAPTDAPGVDCCPAGYTGWYPAPGCKTFFYCSAGAVSSASSTCPSGTLFDVQIQSCNWEDQVNSCPSGC